MKNLFIIFIFTFFCSLSADVERRTAIDIGSGGTKVAIAEIDTDTNKIVQVLFENSYAVPYQASLDRSVDGTFDEATKEAGLKTFIDILAISNSFNVTKTSAIATSAFRKANNSKEFVTKVFNETGIAIQVIPQREEGEIAFFSALSAGNFDSSDVIVWDIGTGSLQMTTMNEEGSLIVYMGENMGSVAFKNYIIDALQDKDLTETNTPNPINEADLKLADAYVRSFGRRAYPIIKSKIKENAPILGIGRLFNSSIKPIASEDNIITRKALRAYINTSLNKSDEELNNPFANVDVTNCILTLAIMKSLHIHEIHPVDSTTAKGLLITPQYWQ